MRDIEYWTQMARQSRGARLLSIYEMESNEEVWNDWLECDNEYAVNDRKSMRAGAGKYLHFIAMILQKRDPHTT